MRREAAREALEYLLQTATMFSLHLISAMVLVYCSMATVGTTSDACMTIKERNENQQPISCEDLDQNLPSGYYNLPGNDGELHSVSCQMEEFGGDQCRQSGGWMRLAAFSPGNTCPGDLVMQGQFCKRHQISSGGCYSVVLQTNGIRYSRVYGKIIGIQKGSTDAFEQTFNGGDNITISDPYIDGISLTYGSPDDREHIWSFASQRSTTGYPSPRHCYCLTNNDKSKQPSFVHDNYFCDTGVPSDETQPEYNVVYSDRPLWDSCGIGDAACCSPSVFVPPWFYREIGETCSDIEMRVCTDQGSDDEDIFIKEMEIYVQ